MVLGQQWLGEQRQINSWRFVVAKGTETESIVLEVNPSGMRSKLSHTLRAPLRTEQQARKLGR